MMSEIGSKLYDRDYSKEKNELANMFDFMYSSQKYLG